MINSQLSNVSCLSLWRLLIDGNRQYNSGSFGFDIREPGYLKGMMSGLNFILSTIDAPLSLDYLEDLHKYCTKHVSTIIEYEY